MVRGTHAYPNEFHKMGSKELGGVAGGGGGVCGFEHPRPSENRLSNLYPSLFYGRPNLNPLTTQIKSQMVSPIATSNDVF